MNLQIRCHPSFKLTLKLKFLQVDYVNLHKIIFNENHDKISKKLKETLFLVIFVPFSKNCG